MTGEQGWVGTWSPTIGDPTLVGWLTVFAYFCVAYLCLRAFKGQKTTKDASAGFDRYVDAVRSLWRTFKGFRRPIAEVPARARIAMFWLIVAAMFVFLGINKQLDLQSLFTEIGRITFHATGLYGQRRVFQLIFIAVLAVTSVVVVYGFVQLLRDSVSKVWRALLGIGVTLTFVFVRALSFHHVDLFLGQDFLGLRVNWLLELTGIAIVGYAAVISAGQRPKRRARFRGRSSGPTHR